MASLKMDPLDPKKAKSLTLNISLRNVQRIETYAKQGDISRSKLIQNLLVLALDGLDQKEAAGGVFSLSFFKALPDQAARLVFSQVGRLDRDDNPDALKKKVVSFTLQQEVIARLTDRANKSGISVSKLAESLMTSALDFLTGCDALGLVGAALFVEKCEKRFRLLFAGQEEEAEKGREMET